MDNNSESITNVQDVKNLLRRNLGVEYALPDYPVEKGCKTHIMVWTELVNSLY